MKLKLNSYLEMARAKDPAKELIGFILEKLDEQGFNRTNKTDTKVNFQTENPKEIKTIIESTLPGLACSIGQPIMSKALGGLSNTFPTYELKLTKNFTYGDTVYPKGLILLVANTFRGGMLGDKSLTPNELRLEDVKWLKANDIQKTVLKNIDPKLGENTKHFAEMLMNEVITKTSLKAKKDGLIDVEDNEQTIIKLSDTTLALINTMDSRDLNIIGKNFGEVLGGIYFFKKYGATNVQYPSQSNFPLIDFIVDDVVYVSAKYASGAAPSIKILAEKVQENPKAFVKVDRRLKSILNAMLKESVFFSYINAAKEMDSVIYHQMMKYNLITDDEKESKQLMNDFLIKKFNSFKQDEEKMAKFLQKEFWQYAKSAPDLDNAMEKLRSGVKTEGIIFYPMESELVDIMNKDEAILSGLKTITKTIGVKQLYFNFEINKKKQNLTFLIKFFGTKDFKFALTSSVNMYLNSNLSFKMT
jgi:hypothetical protein